MVKLAELFNTSTPVIGMVHFAPLPDYQDSPGIMKILELAKLDIIALVNGGVDAVMLENNYDTPHKEFVDTDNAQTLLYLTKELTRDISIPVGLSILWNDYKTALNIAQQTNVSFIRVPVFVDSVETSYGKMYAHPNDIITYRAELKAEDVLLFTDIHVKHATMLEEKTLTRSATEAVQQGSDGIIITGKWTADAPKLNDLQEVRQTVGNDFPVLIGSGANEGNITILLEYSNGIIIGTALKEGTEKSKREETNIKPWDARISEEKTKRFMNKVKNLKQQ